MIAIVGAGITGLALAHELARLDSPFTVFEQADTAGGVIRSARVDGHLLEWGPQRTRSVAAFRALVDDLDLRDEIITAPHDLPLFIYRDGALRTVPRSFADLLHSDLLTVRERVRLLAEPFTRGALPDESVADYFTRKLGRAAYANVVGPLYGGLYASDPADMLVATSLRHTLRELDVRRSLIARAARGGARVAAPSAVSFRDGMQTLPLALLQRHRAHVRLGTRVHTIERAARGYRIHTSDGVADAAHVVCTAGAAAAADVVQNVAPTAAAALRSLHYNPLAIVHLHTTAAVPRALGYQVSFDETLYTRGVTFNDALFGRAGVYTAYLGGARNPGVVEWSDSELARIAIEEFARVTDADARVIAVARTAMPAWDRSWTVLQSLQVPDGLHFCANWESRPGLPGRLAQAKRLAAELRG
jgi:oxygen-dependent protoporphyrinogen oxidase